VVVVHDTAFTVVSGSYAVTGVTQKPPATVMSSDAATSRESLQYQPYDSDEETEASASDSGSESDTESEGSAHDGRMQALDTWRVAAQQWISAPGRAPVSDRMLPVRPLPVMAAAPPGLTASATDIPADLRANDIRRYILHVDSRFRESPFQSTAADFYLRPLAPLKNVLRVRAVSIEIPYGYPFFTPLRRNVSIDVIDNTVVPPVTTAIQIPAGNYMPVDLENVLNASLTAAGVGWLTVVYTSITNRFTFVSTKTGWALDTTAGGASWDRPFDYGLGYYMGAPRGFIDISGALTYEAPGCAVIGGDTYLFLKINDFDCVHQPVAYITPTTTLANHEFTAMAKIRLRGDRNGVAYEDYAGQVLKEVVFQSPRDIPRLHVQVLDAYGEVVDLCTAEFSVALEVLEIQNMTLFESMRNSIMMHYV
jgi:hypothetical protein